MRAVLTTSLVSILIVSGCASTNTELELDNILARKNRRLAGVSESDSAAVKPAGFIQTAWTDDPAQILETSDANPPELSLLELSDDFAPVNELNPDFAQVQKLAQSLSPGATAVWRAPDYDILVIAGKVPLRSEALSDLSRDEFRLHIEKLGGKFAEFYEKRYGTSTQVTVTDTGAVTALEVNAEYTDFGSRKKDRRHIFFYTPDYRLNFLITGKYEDLDRFDLELDLRFDSFRDKLAEAFSKS
ncbi:MAG: hypothetical protein Q8R76_06610 [Candidatus Omnitrophota bacterium]|nr:hypothetical protein [Candidatus Omnitrophota bacterium]